jgi:hypothetical protein
MFGTNLEIEQGPKVRKMESWLHYKPQDGTYLELPTSRQCCDHCKDSCEDGWWFEQHTLSWLPPVGQWDICKWHCSIKFDKSIACHCWKLLTDLLAQWWLTVWQYKPITPHQCAFTPSSSMLVAFDRDVEALVPFFHLCPVLDGSA